MDSWTNEQVEVRLWIGISRYRFLILPSRQGISNVSQNMKKVGNIASNKVYNPQNKKAAIPMDVDEVDSAVERFIRSKYVQRNLNGESKRRDITSRDSDEGPPPPLPPKTGKFGLRAATSIFPLSSKAKRQAAAREAMASTWDSGRSASPQLPNKPSKVFGASVEYNLDDMDKKLAKLRDMGFMDNSRNAVVLKGVNGSLERAIEALVRLGEGDRKSPGPIVSTRESSLRATRSMTPLSSTTSTTRNGQDRPTTPSTVSSNPFDILPAQPQTAQSTGTLQNKNPYFPSTNPFGPPGQNDAMTQAFQNMSLAPAQPLFPNHTGGVPGHSAQPAYYQVQAPISSPAPISFNSYQTYPPPQVQSLAVQSPPSLQQQMTGYNPFFADQAQQVSLQVPQQALQQVPQPQQNLTVNTMTGSTYGNNPFTRSPTRMASPLGQIPEQAQYVTSGAPVQQPAATNPFLAQQPTMTSPVQSPFQSMPAGQPMMQTQQIPQRSDNASILALYNYPHLAPRPFMSDQQAVQPGQPTTQQAFDAQQPRSIPPAAMPGSKNPFLNGSNPASPHAASAVVSTNPFPTANGHGSRESVQLGMEMATWANGGRHSPDAFASLSAKHV